MDWLTPTLILEFVVGLVLLILLHEFGHFLVARWLKVDVLEFGIGLPPRMLKLFTWKGTLFSLNWIPFGGFVLPKGENDPTVKGGLAAASPWVRLSVSFAGPAINFLAGALLFSLVFAQLGVIPDTSKVQLYEIEAGSPAAQAGLLAGDIILEANGSAIETTEELRSVITKHLGEPFELQVERNGEELAFQVTPRANPTKDQGALGIYMGNPYEEFTWPKGIRAGFQQIGVYTKMLGDVAGRLVRQETTADEVGLVGIVGMGNQYIQLRQTDTAEGIPASVSSLIFFATISVSLGIMNLLPIPALDGGRILMVIPEIITGKRVPVRFENWLNGISFLLLLLLLVFINARDIFNLVTK